MYHHPPEMNFRSRTLKVIIWQNHRPTLRLRTDGQKHDNVNFTLKFAINLAQITLASCTPHTDEKIRFYSGSVPFGFGSTTITKTNARQHWRRNERHLSAIRRTLIQVNPSRTGLESTRLRRGISARQPYHDWIFYFHRSSSTGKLVVVAVRQMEYW